MANSDFRRFYTLSDFTVLGAGTVNVDVLRDAINAATTLEPLVDIQLRGRHDVTVVWDNFPSQLAAADSAVAAHTGIPNANFLQSFQSLNETTNATTSFVAKQTSLNADELFVSQPLTAGRWGLSFSAQLRTTTVVVNSGVRAIMRAGLVSVLTPAEDRAYTDHSIFSATQPQLWTYFDVFNVAAGATLRFQPRFARSGSAVTAAMSNFKADLFRIGE